MYRIALTFGLTLLLLAGCVGAATPTVQPTVPVTEEVSPTVGELEPTGTTPATPTPEAEEPTPTAEPEATPTSEPEAPAGWVAYTDPDGNLRLVDLASGEEKQLTEDAAPMEPEKESIRYCCAKWSSDGRLLAYQRELGTPITGGFEIRLDIWVYDASTGEARPVLENQQTAGFAWKPLTHLISYGLIIPMEYFSAWGQTSPEHAQGIWAVDADGGDPFELVMPERGFSIVNPVWSDDGQILSFEEILYIEGRGQFAYYDLEAQEYVAWEEIIGGYDWSPDSDQIVYDRLAYIGTGTERIWIRDREGGEERLISPDFENGYAFNPVFSPQGDQVAYFAELGAPESLIYTLFVQPLQEGEPEELGVFEQAGHLAWAPGGDEIILSAGPFESRQVLVVTVADGSVNVLADGSEPAWQPAVQ